MEPNPGPRTAFGPQWRICHVESLTKKFQIHYFTEINALYQRNVCVPILRSANGLARTGTDRKLRGLNEGGGIENPKSLLIRGHRRGRLTAFLNSKGNVNKTALKIPFHTSLEMDQEIAFSIAGQNYTFTLCG